MHSRTRLIALSAAGIAGILSLVVAVVAVMLIEKRASAEIRSALAIDGITWAEVEADGLLVHLSGTAPDEAARFRAQSITGQVIDAARVIDEMDVTPAHPVEPPEFTLELLRNQAGISMIGLIPADDQRDAIAEAAADAAGGADVVTDMLDTANFPEPEGWYTALEFALDALKRLPRAKISVTADHVTITAISESTEAKRKLEAELAKLAPTGLETTIDISAPRPVITPYTLRFLIDGNGARFDACTADTPDAAEQIMAAARAAGLEHAASCTIGLGLPSPQWAAAAETAIGALAELGGGSLTFSDADVSLLAPQGTAQALFDRVVGELEADLPEVFSLHATLPAPPVAENTPADEGPREFTATKSPEGQVQLRGRITDELSREATESYAKSRFGIGNVYAAMRLDEALPDGWPVRVLTALEGLSRLNNGRVLVDADTVELAGVTGDPDAKEEIARIFADQLGDSADFAIDVRYEEALDPIAALPTPEECVASVNAVLAEQKITFEPGSATLQGDSMAIIERIAEVLKGCPDVQMEIGGHTDSQGREVMNEQLSQQRANAVLNALMARRILTSNLTAKGYGESVPIASNDTEEGREANRRIEFRLVLPEEEGPAEPAEEAAATGADEQGTDEETVDSEAGGTNEQN